MSAAIGLAAARFLHDAALMVLFGSSFFPFYTYRSLAERHELSSWLLRVRILAGIATFLTALLVLLFTSAEMSGSFAWKNIALVLSDTGFGQIWLFRLVLSALLLLPLYSVVAKGAPLLLLFDVAASATLLASLSLTGHAQTNFGPPGLVHEMADALHLLAAGAWLGGLLPLAWILARRHGNADPQKDLSTEEILLRFSSIGVMAVLTLIVTGLVNSWFLVGSPTVLFTTPYGTVLLVKLILFAVMASLAGANRFWIMPRLARGKNWHTRLRLHVLAEQILGVLILVAVGYLGTLPPAIEG